MAWTPKVWVDRSVEFAGRRILTPTGNANEYDVTRSEGTVFVVGDEPDAANLNAEFGNVKTELDTINTNLTANSNSFIFAYDSASASYGYKAGGADTFHPFSKNQMIASMVMQGSTSTTANNARLATYSNADYATITTDDIKILKAGSYKVTFGGYGGHSTATATTRLYKNGVLQATVSQGSVGSVDITLAANDVLKVVVTSSSISYYASGGVSVFKN